MEQLGLELLPKRPNFSFLLEHSLADSSDSSSSWVLSMEDLIKLKALVGPDLATGSICAFSLSLSHLKKKKKEGKPRDMPNVQFSEEEWTH